MPGAQAPSTVIPFGPFEADLHAQELRKSGVRLRLPRQSFQILKMLLEHPGELVTREDMRAALWPSDTFVDFEHGLNAAINRLREALGDEADNPRYIETLPRRGYRFLAPLSQPAPVQVIVRLADDKHDGTAPKSRMTIWLSMALAVFCVLLAVVFYWYRSSTRLPRVLTYRQLTSDRQRKGATPCGFGSFIVTDGPRVFFSEPGATVAQVSSAGGDTVKLPTPFNCFGIFDISPDKSELIGETQEGAPAPPPADQQPLWSLAIASGLAHRLGNLTRHAAAWSPDGQSFAYATGGPSGPNDLYVASRDGTQEYKLTTISNGQISSIRWSPNGAVLRMEVSGRLWEVTNQGTDLHEINILPNDIPSCCGVNWTPDGRYFMFSAFNPDSASVHLWFRQETKSLFRRTVSQPFQFSSGATFFFLPAPAPDGKHIFAAGGQIRGELLRFDLKSGKLEPFLGGIYADQLDFSRDGRWVAYIALPDHTL